MPEMKMQSRSVILFMDNATVHPQSLIGKYSNIKIVFFPNNATSRLQLLDAGIIKNFKVEYRKKLMRYVLVWIVDDRNAYEIDIIQTIEWITSAWKEVSKDTSKNCFAKCGVAEGPAIIDDDKDVDEELSFRRIIWGVANRWWHRCWQIL